MLRFEMVQAQEGDCFVLRWLDGAQTRIGVIDAGPKGVYPNLRRRLSQLASPGKTLPLDWVMVSHIDDDHINGMVDLTTELRLAREKKAFEAFRIRRMWFNRFEDIAEVVTEGAPAGAGALAGISTHLPVGDKLDPITQAVLASVGQGRTVRDNLETLKVEDTGLLTTSAQMQEIDGLEVTIVGPLEAELEALRKKWKETKGGRSAALASYSDKSIANLSSLVCHISYGVGAKARTLLLTGDARGDLILDGLREVGLLKGKRLEVDLLKVPHHGSDRNTKPEFFETVVARHYVVSANGKHENPDVDTLEWIIEARDASAEYTIHLSNELPWMKAFFAKWQAGRKFKVGYRGTVDDSDAVLEINLD